MNDPEKSVVAKQFEQGFGDGREGKPKNMFTEAYLVGYENGKVQALLDKSSLRWTPKDY